MAITTKDLLAAERESMKGGEPHPQDDDYSPPVTTVKLPSCGMVYPPESPLYMAETLDVKAMTAKEEDILSTPALIKKGEMVSTLVRACVTNRLVDPNKMLTGDRNALMIAIRVASYGAEYGTDVVCEECGEESSTTFDLGRLPMRMLTEHPEGGIGTNVFSFKLPSMGRTAKFKLFTVEDVARLDKDAENMRKAKGVGGPEQSITMRLLAQVLSIEGITQEKLPKTIVNMPARDSRALRKRMDDLTPGVDMEQRFECPACGKETEVDVQLGPEFFWPSR